MKRYLLSGLAALLFSGAFAPLASASQTHFGDLRADLNGDGEVSPRELKSYNRAMRGK